MPGTRETLARRYRRLLLSYPRQYRRERGAEIVATFLDLAPADRVRPTVRESVNLVRNGLRCRLGRPRSRMVVLWAAVTAVVWGLLVGSFATLLAWETARPLPTRAQATDLFTQVLDEDPGDVYVDAAMFAIYGQPLGWDNAGTLLSVDAGEFQQGRASAVLNGPASANRQDVVDTTVAWLHANGWRVSEVDVRYSVQCATASCDEATLPRKAVYTAARADDVLRFEVSLGDPRRLPTKPGVPDSNIATSVYIEWTRATPAAALPFGAAGALLGFVLGWLLFGWASRRTEGRSSATVLFGIAAFMWCTPIVFALPSTVAHHRSEWHPSWHPMWEWLGLPSFMFLFVIGTGAALLALAVAALPQRRGGPAVQATPAG